MITPTALSGALLLVFAPSAGSFSLHAPTPTLRRMQPRQVAVVAPQMMALPAFGGGGKKKDAYEGPSEEAQAALRMIGVSEDATYDEVTEAYQELCTKYKGETKRLIRLQAAKDIVLEDRLRQRMAGAFKSDIADRVGKNMDIGDNRKAPKEPLITLPAWAEPYMELPTKKLLLRNALLFGAISIMSIVAKHLAPTSCAMGFGFGFFLLYNRGIPATSSTSIDEMQVNREVAKKPVFIAAGLTILFGAIGGTLSQLLPLAYLLEEATVAVGVVLGFFTSATFFKVQEDEF